MSFAGVSFIVDGKPSKSSSSATTAAAVTVSGYHLLVVEDYSRSKDTQNGEYILSGVFELGGYRWCILYYPNGNKPENADGISLELLLWEDKLPREPLKVQFGFSFVDQVEKQEPSHIRATKTFSLSAGTCLRMPCIMKREAFERSNHLRNDSFTVRCDIVVITMAVDIGQSAATIPFFAVPPRDIEQHLSALLESKEGADVMFEVGGELFFAHRCILAARSPVFKAQLYGPKKAETPNTPILIKDMDAEVFKLLLGFMYSDSVPEIKGPEYLTWQDLLVAADTYHLLRLKLICQRKLCACIDTGSVAPILEIAEKNHCRGLKEACLDFLKSPANLQQVMAVGGLDYLTSSCPSVLKELIAKLASLKIDN